MYDLKILQKSSAIDLDAITNMKSKAQLAKSYKSAVYAKHRTYVRKYFQSCPDAQYQMTVMKIQGFYDLFNIPIT